MKLLHIDSSILGDASVSRTLSAAVVERLLAATPGLAVEHHDLAVRPMPHLSLLQLSGEAATDALEAFLAADVVVIGVPMYNFGVSSHLKAWIDHIVIAGRTFQYGADGVVGLARGKRVILALSRGGIYSEGSPGEGNEHAERYLRSVFDFIGVDAVDVVLAEGVAFGEESRLAAIAEALRQVASLPPIEQAAA